MPHKSPGSPPLGLNIDRCIKSCLHEAMHIMYIGTLCWVHLLKLITQGIVEQSCNRIEGFTLEGALWVIRARLVFGISQDFPREIVEIRRGLVRVLKHAKKEGRDAKLVYDKLYINGQRYIP